MSTQVIQRPANGFGEGAIEIVGLHDGVEAGRVVGLPFCVQVEGREYRVLAGSDLRVDAAHRRSNLGLLLPEALREASPDGIAVAAAVSRMAQPVYEFLGFANFTMMRYAMPLHGRRHFGRLVGAAVAVYRRLLEALVSLRVIRYEFAAAGVDDERTLREVARLIAADPHVCAEVHDEAWLRRHLSESFTGESPLQLTVVKKAGRIVGFALVKLRRKGAVRNLKDVRLGSVVEWQFADEAKPLAGWLLARVALAQADVADLVEAATADESVLATLRRFGWRRAGECNFMIGVSERSPLAKNEAIRQAANWRLRPAMADNGLC